MNLRVVKFGGTSVGDIAKIKFAANIVKDIISSGDRVIVVVSAMAGMTNKILSLCNDITQNNTKRTGQEFDAALSTGESLSASLLSLALNKIGIESRSLQSWQISIKSNSLPNNALIQDIDKELLHKLLGSNIVPVIAGFQAINDENMITTLGRGGSDTTASAIAAAFSANYCDIYTDVEGVYSADPRIVHDAKIIEKLSFDEMIEFAGAGAKVLHPRSVEICMRYGINLRIFSSYNLKSGTEIMHSVTEINRITGISYIKKLCLVEILCNDKELENFITEFTNQDGNIYQIISYESDKFKFILSEEYIHKLQAILDEKSIDCKITKTLGSVKIVGAAVRHDLKIFKNILKSLDKHKIKYHALSNSEVKFSILVDEINVEKLVRILHEELLNE
jgi:aspartate kinase